MTSPLPALLLEGAAKRGLAVAWVSIRAVMEEEDKPKDPMDPRQRFPWARTVVSFALPYPAPAAPPGMLEGRIAAFAAYDWYGALKERLRGIAKALREQFSSLRVKVLVEGPLHEKAWAWRSGLGWRGRNSLLFHPTWGSRLLLGELLLSEELESAKIPEVAVDSHQQLACAPECRCGDCRLCLEACPTGALEENQGSEIQPSATFFRIRTERCLDTLTLHKSGSLAEWARPALGRRLVGCDICQEVCPYNQVLPFPPFCSSDLPPGPGWNLSIPSSLAMDEFHFQAAFTGHTLGHLPFPRFQRNCLAAGGNIAGSAIEESIRPFLNHPDPILSEQAAWSLARLASSWKSRDDQAD